MFVVYYISVTTVGTWATDWANEGVFGDGWSLFGLAVPSIPSLIEGLLESLGTAAWLNGLILDGIVAGVGAVLGFVPQMLVLFFFLAVLESCGTWLGLHLLWIEFLENLDYQVNHSFQC